MFKKINNLKIPVKLAICFILIGMIGATGGIVGKIIRNQLVFNDDRLYNESTIPLSYLTYIHGTFLELQIGVENLEKASGTNGASYTKGLEDNLNKIDSYLKKYEATDNGNTDITKIKELFNKYSSTIKHAIDLVNSNRKDQIGNLSTDVGTIGQALNIEVYNLIDQKVAQAEDLIEHNKNSSSEKSNIMFVIVVIGILMVIVLGWLMSRSISIPLNKMVNAANKVSNGDIDVDLDVNIKDEVGILADSFRRIIESLKHLTYDTDLLAQSAIEGMLSVRADSSKHSGEFKKIIDGINKTLDAVIEPVKEAEIVLKEMSTGNLTLRLQGDYKGDHAEIKYALNKTLDALSIYISEINNASEQLLISANHVSDGSQSMSQGATEQASAIEELTSSIAHIANQTKENAASASRANDMGLKVQQNAEKGNLYMEEMLKSMKEIDKASANISKVIKVIDEIAFQTNILSLNAAVEAARAGQHGKGFAVVADEVRNLASRSAEAAKETSMMIEDSIEKVNNGMIIAGETAGALNEIFEGTSKVTSFVGDISMASSEQASAIVQINQGIEQLSLVVQSNSATAEEGAAASEELSGQADLMKKMVEKFQLREYITSENQDFYNLSILNSLNFDKSKADKENMADKKAISDREFGKY